MPGSRETKGFPSPALPPSSSKVLDARVRLAAAERGVPERRIRAAVSNTVVAQLLPVGVVKGGTGLKLRLGEEGSRFTPDLDTASAADTRVFEESFAEALSVGWGVPGAMFTGTISRLAPARPRGVPTHYVMQPFKVKLSYNDRSWGSVDLEVGHDEIQCTVDPEHVIAADLVTLFAELGLGAPGPVPVIAVEHQLAQKIHAMTAPGSERAHDLVDAQLLATSSGVDVEKLGDICSRLFRYRGTHGWPAQIVAPPVWTALYGEAVEGTGAPVDLLEAVVWANQLIDRAASAST